MAHRRRLLRVLFGVACAQFAGAVGAWLCGVRINLTASMPVGLYRMTSARPVRGSIVLVCLPGPVANFAKVRGYVGRGPCVGGTEPLGKIVAAAVGDSISLTADGMVVNGAILAGTSPLVADSHGRPLPPLRRPTTVVTDGHVWLYSPFSAHSFDSRYFGPVPTTSVVAVLQPILVFAGARDVEARLQRESRKGCTMAAGRQDASGARVPETRTAHQAPSDCSTPDKTTKIPV